ncbi:putative amidoligase [Trichophaea hybrida]|nr:putative amidoligase [Trichophaea hybrida]
MAHTYPITLDSLTFGIEVEMITCYLTPQASEYRTPPQEIIRPKVAELLSRSGFLSQQVGSYGPDIALIPDYHKWSVGYDMSIDYQAQDISPILTSTSQSINQIIHSDLEIATPILHFNSPKPWIHELSTVIQLLNTGNFRSAVNKTCGIHVHVGYSNPSGSHFPLEVVKKVAAVMILAEPALDKFHPETRRGHKSFNETIRYLPHIAYMTDAAVFDLIFSAQTIAQIQQHTSRDRPHKFAVVSVGEKKTLEFRQHEGTLDVGVIRMWVGFVARLVCEAANMSSEILRALLTTGNVTPKVILERFIKDEEICGYYRFATSQ